MPGDLHSKTAISLNGMNLLVFVSEIQSVVGEKGAELSNIISIKYSVSSEPNILDHSIIFDSWTVGCGFIRFFPVLSRP
jgi:hypothetical protein